MRKSLAISVLFTSLLVAVISSARGEADPDNIVEKLVSQIHVPYGPRGEQLDELVRQLRISAFVDAGREWHDEDSKYQDEIYKKSALTKFSFESGTVAEALDAFCKQRPFQWRVWKEANAIWIEPKDQAHKASEFYLRRPLNSELLAVAHGNASDRVGDAWAATRKLPDEERTGFNLLVDRERVVRHLAINSRGLPEALLLSDNSRPGEMLEIVREWVFRQHCSIVGLEEYDESGTTTGVTRHVRLAFGSINERRHEMPIEEVLSGLFHDSATPEGFANWQTRTVECTRELYRRMKSDPEKTFAIIRSEKVLERAIESSKYYPILFYTLIPMDAERFGNLLIEIFDSGSKDIERKMLELGIFKDGKRFKAFLKKLTKSDDEGFRKTAEVILKNNGD